MVVHTYYGPFGLFMVVGIFGAFKVLRLLVLVFCASDYIDIPDKVVEL